jgi:hypothetical protein
MSDEIVLNEKTYVSSKKAAEATGYARDYIGQLARGAHIEAERVGGLWYVSMESLQNYEKNAEIARSVAPASAGSKEAESMLSFEGKDYISASRASKLSGYNQDYVGQLARGGKIPSRQIGNRWYVDRDALLAHKAEKDALLAAVQADSVGLQSPRPYPYTTAIEEKMPVPMHYSPEKVDLIPAMAPKSDDMTPLTKHVVDIRPLKAEVPEVEVAAAPIVAEIVPHRPPLVPLRSKKSRKMATVAFSGAALTVVIVAAVGFAAFGGTATFATIQSSGGVRAMTASVGGAATKIGDIVEDWVSPELIYNREH